MFPRGPRFEPIKIPDVPGPNAYNVVSGSELDEYKRGALFEKAGRFSKEKESEVPGPGTYDVEPKRKPVKPAASKDRPQGQTKNLDERYAALQRKVEDLERVHKDGKKAHQVEVERLKLDLSRCQKLTAEHADRHDKQKKQIDTLEARIQDLKKATAADQAEIKDLRVKLRMSEHEKTQLVAKQGEAGELKKSLQSLESKRREEVRERDKRIADLEKALAAEKRRKDVAETALQDLKGKGDEELHSARATVQKLEAELTAAQAEAKRAQTALTSFEEAAGQQEEDLLLQLEQHRALISMVAEEYGRLARSTVSAAAHERLQHQQTTSQIQLLRLERRLANSNAQVDELANLIKSTTERNVFLSQRLQEAEDEIAFHIKMSQESRSISADPADSSAEIFASIQREQFESQKEILTVDTRTVELSAEYYRLACEELLVEYVIAHSQLKVEQQVSEQQASSLSSALASHEAIAARLETVQEERAALDMQLKVATELSESLKSSSELLARRAAEADDKVAEAAKRNEAALQKERDIVRRLNETVQRSRMAEDALRAEIEQLSAELDDAARYQEAYYSLSDEVGSLVARNQLAEEEVQKLSKFNAEILGHNNPAQRIMYVDKIRSELAEVKHKLVMLTREQENALAVNGDLQNELEMYKSVMVPADQKPRTTITRVARPPLVNLTRSLNTNAVPTISITKSDGSSEKVTTQRIHALEPIQGDMTIEEIM
ncbi:hypothetical protein LshimejAT787_0401780 [Lyophyllum shimeji]|uniref:Uncharacterized protein n=1 Tax=Lyophyllum shimeji TaxID=47721 RepID=A0A9P3PKS1_LYOSH|nr:hypothetical protein LshimejAT787_0401780 [Lyophyllum shimeji]